MSIKLLVLVVSICYIDFICYVVLDGSMQLRYDDDTIIEDWTVV